MDTLKDDYTEAAIRERIAGKRNKAKRKLDTFSDLRVGLLVDIEGAISVG
jgi:hypothetical protein